MRGSLAAALLALSFGGCAGTRAVKLSPEVAQALGAGQGAYLSGDVRAVHRGGVLEDRDFVYAAAFSPDGARVAWVHLGGDGFRLAIAEVEGDPEARRDVLLGPVEFDVEGLAFTPDGAYVSTASRDGMVRLVASTGAGTIDGLGFAEAPLTSVAVHPSGRFLAAGDVVGTVHFFSLPDLLPMGELDAHRDVIGGLAFTSEGLLVTGSWDRTLALHELQVSEREVTHSRVRPVREDGHVFLRAALNDRAQVPLAIDTRMPHVVLSSSAAQAAGIDVRALTESVDVATAMGTQRAPIARGVGVRFRELELTLDVAICDPCLPKGAQGVLGAPFEAKASTRFDPNGTAVLTRVAPESAGAAEAAAVPRAALVTATERARHEVGAHVNALSLDARGTRVALALSEQKALRTREIYQREKDGVVEPQADGNAAVVLGLQGFRELSRQVRHRGVVSAVALSPDGETFASGGWDRRVYVRPVGVGPEVGDWKAGWSVRQLRFSADGRRLVAGAWTPIVATGSGRSDPAVQLFNLDYASPRVITAADDGP